MWGFVPDCQFYMSFLMPVLHCLDYYTFELSFEIGKCESSNTVLHFQDCSGNSELASTILTPRDKASPTPLLPRYTLWSPTTLILRLSSLILKFSLPHSSTLVMWAFSRFLKHSEVLPAWRALHWYSLCQECFPSIPSSVFSRLTYFCHSGLCSNVNLR